MIVVTLLFLALLELARALGWVAPCHVVSCFCTCIKGVFMSSSVRTIPAAGRLGLLSDLQRRIGSVQLIPLFSPGLPAPIRKQLHRYNE